MNRKLEYVADKPDRVGRFGVLKKGDIIKVDEQEYREGLKSDKFISVRDRSVVVDPDDELKELPEPVANRFFDLRTVPWNQGSILVHLRRRSKPTLDKIAMALQEATGISVPYGPKATANEVSDGVFQLAQKLGWTV